MLSNKYLKGFMLFFISLVILSKGNLLLSQNAQEVKENIEKAAVQTQGQPDSNVANNNNESEETIDSAVKTVDSQTEEVPVRGNGLIATVKQGGFLMIFLILIGIIALTIIIERVFFYTRFNVWTNDFMVEHIESIAKGSMAKYKEDLEDELRTVFQIYSNKLERGLSLLSGLGNLAPVVGFLGTVIGMIGAFSDIMEAASVNAKVVASGIKVALVTTAGGLVVAAPALAAFYFFMHIIQSRYSKAEEVISDLSDKLPRLSEKLTEE